MLAVGCSRKAREVVPNDLRYLAPLSINDPLIQPGAWEGFARDTGIRVDADVLERSDIENRLLDLLSGSAAYDLAVLESMGRLSSLRAAKAIRPLAGLWEATNYRKDLARAFSAAMNEDFLPASAYGYGFVYRPSALKKLGIRQPASFKEFKSACEAIRDSGATPIASGGMSPWSLLCWFDYLDIRMNGTDFHARLLAGEKAFSDKKTLKAFKALGDLADSGFFGPSPAEGDWITGLNDVASDRSAFFLIGAYFLDRLPASMAGDYGFMPFPVSRGEGRGELASCEGFVLPASGGSPEHALLLAKSIREALGAAEPSGYRIRLNESELKGLAAGGAASALTTAEASIFLRADKAVAGSDLALDPQTQASLSNVLRSIIAREGARDYEAAAKELDDARTGRTQGGKRK
jgi:hypothetical protein